MNTSKFLHEVLDLRFSKIEWLQSLFHLFLLFSMVAQNAYSGSQCASLLKIHFYGESPKHSTVSLPLITLPIAYHQLYEKFQDALPFRGIMAVVSRFDVDKRGRASIILKF